MKKKTSQAKGKKDRFTLQNYYPELPRGWGLYNEYENEEKGNYMAFLHVSKHYKAKHESGDEKAIITFVKHNPECFRELWPFPDNTSHTCYSNNNVFFVEHDGKENVTSKRENGRSWVIDQIEKWRIEGTPEAKEKIRTLFNAYLDDRGKRKHDSKEDTKIYNQIKTRLPSCNGNVDNAISELLDATFPPKVTDLISRIAKQKNPDYQLKCLKDISKKEGIHLRKLKTLMNNPELQSFNTYREIYYKRKKLEEEYEREEKITEINLRLAYFLPTKDIQIPEKYAERFNKELSLYYRIELLRTDNVSFPRLRRGIPVPSGVFKGNKLPIKKALQKVSKEEKRPISELTELYRIYKEHEALYTGNECLKILKDL